MSVDNCFDESFSHATLDSDDSELERDVTVDKEFKFSTVAVGENAPNLFTDNGSDKDGFSIAVDEDARNFSIENSSGKDGCSVAIGSDNSELEEGASIDGDDKVARVVEDDNLSELSTDNSNDKDGCNFSLDGEALGLGRNVGEYEEASFSSTDCTDDISILSIDK